VSAEYRRFCKDIGASVADLSENPAREVLDVAMAWPHRWMALVRYRNAQRVFRPEMHYIKASSWPNAVINRIDNTHCIGVYESVWLPMIEISRFLFSRRDVFPFIGNARREHGRPWPTSIPLGLTRYSRTASKRYEELVELITPVCPIRYGFSGDFMAAMIEFLWMHELAHGLEGHCEYYKDKYKASELYEVSNEKRRESTIFNVTERQVMETVADELAMQHLLSPFIMDFHTRRTEIRLSFEQWVSVRFIALVMVQFLWCQIESIRDGKDLFVLDKMSLYPVASYRVMAPIIAMMFLEKKDARFKRASRGIKMAFKHLVHISETYPQFSVLADIFDIFRQNDQLDIVRKYLNENAETVGYMGIFERYRYTADMQL
jgi:hypothetical protein